MLMMKKKNKLLKSFCIVTKACALIKLCGFMKIAVCAVAVFLLVCNTIKMCKF